MASWGSPMSAAAMDTCAIERFSKRRTTRYIRVVRVCLERDIVPAAQTPDIRCGTGIRRIFLSAVVFQHHSPVQIRAVRQIRLAALVRVTRVCIVGTEHKAVRLPCAVDVCADTQPVRDIFQCVPEKGRVRPLPREASHLLVVEYGEHVNIALRSLTDDPLHPRKDTREVIIPRRHDKLVIRPRENRLLTVLHKKVIGQNTVLLFPQRACSHGGDHSLRGPLPPCHSEQGQHVVLRAERRAVVRVAVHVDRKARYHAEILFQTDRFCLYPALTLHADPSRDRERSVQPCGQDHAAIFFRIHADVHALLLDLRVLLDFERGGVRVGCVHVIPADLAGIAVRHTECDHGRPVPDHKIVPALLQSPYFPLRELHKVRPQKLFSDIFYRVIACQTAV